ncbi:MAG: sodium ion-translocating decarboxylase subunit beta [Lachnospiraceae bacterium]|nr:sodium ion-translocating decarboxylase subunit beta [Lachnospiraceae bacterium]
MKKLATAILGVVGVGLFAFGLVVKVMENTAISIIGGADGPTSVFLAGNLGGASSTTVMVSGMIAIALCCFIGCKKSK